MVHLDILCKFSHDLFHPCNLQVMFRFTWTWTIYIHDFGTFSWFLMMIITLYTVHFLKKEKNNPVHNLWLILSLIQMSSMILYWNKVQWSSEGKLETTLSNHTANITFPFHVLSLNLYNSLYLLLLNHHLWPTLGKMRLLKFYGLNGVFWFCLYVLVHDTLF